MTRRKNLLLITADQWRGDCLAHLGHPGVSTPNVTRLAEKGLTFRRHYAQGTPCAPSRMSLYSGQYVFNHRVVSNDTPINPHVPTLPRYLRGLGYEPMVAGHTSTIWSAEGRAVNDPILTQPTIGPEWSPLAIFDGEHRRYLEYIYARGYKRYEDYDDIFKGLPLPSEIELPSSPIAEEHSETAWLVDNTLEYIEYATDRPWAIHLSLFKPHPPFLPSARFADAARAAILPGPVRDSAAFGGGFGAHPFVTFGEGLPLARHLWPDLEGRAADIDDISQDCARRAYFALCNEVDFHLGRLLDALDSSGAAEDTLVIFTSDHGEMLGDLKLWGKATCFPEAFHIPLIIRDPSAAADGSRGRVIDDFTENVDLLPTLISWLGGAQSDGWDGRSLLPYLHDGGHPSPRPFVTFEFDFRNYVPSRLGALAALDPKDMCLAAILSREAFHVHFPALPPLSFHVQEPGSRWCGPDYTPAADTGQQEIEKWATAALLEHRMRHADNSHTGLVSSPRGIIPRAQRST